MLPLAQVITHPSTEPYPQPPSPLQLLTCQQPIPALTLLVATAENSSTTKESTKPETMILTFFIGLFLHEWLVVCCSTQAGRESARRHRREKGARAILVSLNGTGIQSGILITAYDVEPTLKPTRSAKLE